MYMASDPANPHLGTKPEEITSQVHQDGHTKDTCQAVMFTIKGKKNCSDDLNSQPRGLAWVNRAQATSWNIEQSLKKKNWRTRWIKNVLNAAMRKAGSYSTAIGPFWNLCLFIDFIQLQRRHSSTNSPPKCPQPEWDQAEVGKALKVWRAEIHPGDSAASTGTC